MLETKPMVFIVDDDEAVRDGINQLVKSVNLNAATFASAQEFLDSHNTSQPGCLILDVRMPGMSGLKLQDKLKEKNINLPVIFITGHGEVPMAVNALKNGAFHFIEKPVGDQILLEHIQDAIVKDAKNRQIQIQKQIIVDRIESLTPKEKQIMYMVADGKLNKVIAYELEINQKTVEFHRANIMKKMQADSLAELVKLLARANMLH